MPGVTKPITVGNLIMFHNSNGTALEYVTGVSGQVITFAAGDPAGLNQTGLTQWHGGKSAERGGGGFPPTSITRVWMVTYYIDSTTNPAAPQLIRQVNYPNFPAGPAAVNPPQAIADNVENLSFSYDITASNFPGLGIYPTWSGQRTYTAAAGYSRTDSRSECVLGRTIGSTLSSIGVSAIPAK